MNKRINHSDDFFLVLSTTREEEGFANQQHHHHLLKYQILHDVYQSEHTTCASLSFILTTPIIDIFISHYDPLLHHFPLTPLKSHHFSSIINTHISTNLFHNFHAIVINCASVLKSSHDDHPTQLTRYSFSITPTTPQIPSLFSALFCRIDLPFLSSVYEPHRTPAPRHC